MIQKLLLQSLISKYYLGINESVKWVIKDNTLSIKFMSPNGDIIGEVTCSDFELEDVELAIFNTHKLKNLTSITNGEFDANFDCYKDRNGHPSPQEYQKSAQQPHRKGRSGLDPTCRKSIALLDNSNIGVQRICGD